MPASALHVVPDESFEDWIVRDDKGIVFGHYATEDVAESIAEAIARRCGDDVVIHFPDARGWFDGKKELRHRRETPGGAPSDSNNAMLTAVKAAVAACAT